VDLPFVSFRDTYTFGADGAVITSHSTLRFRDREEVAASLATAGYQILDIREAPDRVYLTGRYSRRLSLLGRLPTPILDRARRRVFHLPAPGTLAT
jgi:hypothetical protein